MQSETMIAMIDIVEEFQFNLGFANLTLGHPGGHTRSAQ